MHRLLTVILALLGMVGALAIDTYLPSMPAIGVAFDVGPVAVQQTLSIFLFTFAFMMLFYGTLSDSFGRRPVILVALVVYLVASIIAARTNDFSVLLLCRAFQGLAAGAGTVIGQAIVQDRFEGAEAQRMLSNMMMVFGLAPAIAPILGGYLQVNFGWRSTFVFLALFSGTMIAFAYKALPESLPVEKRHAFHPIIIAKNYIKVLGQGQFVLLAFSLGLAFGGLSLYISAAAHFVIDILHLPETAFGWMFIPMIGGMTVGSAIGSKYATHIAPSRMIWLGFALMGAAGLGGMAYTANVTAAVPWAVIPLAVYTFGLAFAMPALQVKALALFPDNRGLASSMQAFVQMMTFALVAGLVAPLLFHSAYWLASGLTAGIALSFVCWRLACRFDGEAPV